MLSLVADFQEQKALALNPKFVDGLRSILRNTSLDKVKFFVSLLWFVADLNYNVCRNLLQEFIAKAITLPGQGEIMDMMAVADPDAVHAVRNFIKKELALQLKDDLLAAVSGIQQSCCLFLLQFLFLLFHRMSFTLFLLGNKQQKFWGLHI